MVGAWIWLPYLYDDDDDFFLCLLPLSVVSCVCVFFFLVLSSVAVLLADILSVYVVLLYHYLLLIVIMLSSFVQIGTFALLLLSHLTHKHNPGLVRPRASSLGAVSWGQLLVFVFFSGPLTRVHKKERNVSDWAFRVRYWFVRIIGWKEIQLSIIYFNRVPQSSRKNDTKALIRRNVAKTHMLYMNVSSICITVRNRFVLIIIQDFEWKIEHQ